MKHNNMRKIVIAIGLVLLFVIGFFVFGLFIDIQIILKYNYTPISFTFTHPFIGAFIGFLLAFRFAKHMNGQKKL